MTQLPHSTWLRSFEAAARHSSFSAAAIELGLTPAAVSQQIRLLEAQLGAPLFERLARGVALTDRGQAYAQTVRKAFAEMHVATETLFSRPAQRRVQVRAPITCAALLLAPRLEAFHVANPDIVVELTTFVWADRFANDRSDIDIRYGHGDWTDGNAQHLGHEHVVPVCHSDRVTPGLTLDDLTRQGVVQIIGYEAEWQNLSDMYELGLTPPHTVARVDSSLLALQMVRAGHGCTLVLERFLQGYTDDPALVTPFPYRAPVQHAHYLVLRDPSAAAPDVARVCEWISAVFRDAR